MQNDVLLSGSILENITFFDTTPDLEKVRYAASMANIAQDISRMPMQFQTMVGSMGAALSGGQIQRILLARAIYQEPGLLVLDEATSHLDIHTEACINRRLRQLGIPCVMVAHRPETVLSADRILYLTPEGLSPVSPGQFRELVSNDIANDVITI
jgi:ATP-binding cassette subfamily B protein RaxB